MNALRVALVLFVLALAASLMGWQPLAEFADDGAKVLLLLAVVLFLFTFAAPKPSA